MFRTWEIRKVLHHERTPWQEILIAQTAHGVTLFCDNERQSAELTQLPYHEAQTVPALLLSEHVNRILIIGSSEGVVTNICRDSGAQEICHVEIDEACLRACARHLPYGYTETDVDRYLDGEDNVRLFLQDGYKFVQDSHKGAQLFDIIILDLPDEDASEKGQHNRLYSLEFTRQLCELLEPGGCLISQAGCATYWRNRTLRSSWSRNGMSL